MTAEFSGFLHIVSGLAPLFYALLLMSVTAGLAGLVILLIRRILDRKLSPFWKYLMWFIVLLALVIPFRPQSDLALVDTDAIARRIPYSGSIATSSLQASEMPDSAASEIPASSNDAAGQTALTVRTWIFDIAIPAVWAGGVLCLTLFILTGGLRLRRRIRSALTPDETAPYEELLETCKAKIGLPAPGPVSAPDRSGVPTLLGALRARILSPVTVVVQDQVGFPVLLGVIRPRILFPLYVRELDGVCLENIMLHELSHVKRCDHLVNGLLLILKILYWFNPVVWLICRFIKQDMEVANDAAVLRHMDGAAQKNYGLSLVEVLARGNAPALMPRLLCMADNVKNTERRIGMIRLNEVFKRRKALIAIVALLIILVVSVLFLTQRGDAPAPPAAENTATQVIPDATASPAPQQMFPLEKAREEAAYKLSAADGDGTDDKSYNLDLLDRFIANMKSGIPDEVNVIYYLKDTKGAVSIKDWYYLTFDGRAAKLYGYYELDDGTFSYDASGVLDGWTVDREEIEGGINYRIRFGDGDADTMHFFWAENPVETPA
jgi:bla regulator protein BlaR1